MGQMFDKTRDQMNKWRWDNPHAFGDQVNHSNPQTIISGKVKCTGQHFSWYGSADLNEKIEPLTCWQYKPGNFLAVRPRNWYNIFDEDDDDENWAEPGAPRGGRRSPGDGNDNGNSEGEEYTQGGDNGTGKGKDTKNGKWKGKRNATEQGKGKGKGNSTGKGIVKQTPGGDDISHAVDVQLKKEMYEADLDTEG